MLRIHNKGPLGIFGDLKIGLPIEQGNLPFLAGRKTHWIPQHTSCI